MNKINDEDYVEILKQCADTIKERAEEIIGNIDYTTGYKVIIELAQGSVATIKCEKDIFPHQAYDIH